MKMTVAYITTPGKEEKETRVYNHQVESQQKELLMLLHKVACGMEPGKQITFQSVEA